MTLARNRSSELGPSDGALPELIADKPLSRCVRVPPAAIWLGASGAIPFVILAVAGALLGAPLREQAHFALTAYGAVILSFLGGVHWGLAIAGVRPTPSGAVIFARLAVSTVPSLIGWVALLITGPEGFLALSAAFISLGIIDWYASREALVPAWYPKLRWPLTIVVTACLMLAAVV